MSAKNKNKDDDNESIAGRAISIIIISYAIEQIK
jgi:hypothetical protein